MWGACSGNLAKASVSVPWDEKSGTGSPDVRSAAPITCRSSVPEDGKGSATNYYFPGTARDCLKVWRDASGGAVCMFY